MICQREREWQFLAIAPVMMLHKLPKKGDTDIDSKPHDGSDCWKQAGLVHSM